MPNLPPHIAATLAVATAFQLAPSLQARAAEIASLALESLKAPLELLVPDFERATGHKVRLGFGNSSTLPKRFETGEPFDAAFASALLINRYIKEGKVARGTRTDVARVAIGMGVKKGTPKPDISTADAFKRALLNAKSISHASEGPSGIYLKNLLQRLDIAAQVQPKLRPVPGGPLVMGPVAKGDVEIGIITVPFIMLEPGADFVGALPDELQDYVVYASGLSATTKIPDAANALIRYVTSPAAASVLKSHGLDSIAR
jgi:molybdate transport system substrate-binding protein